MGIKYNKFYRWYKNSLSEFKTQKEQYKLHKHDIKKENFNSRYEQNIRVPILKLEHLGTHMAIDEKHINQTFYTVLTNGETGKVALMIASMNPKEVGKCLVKFGEKLLEVTTITRDLSPTYQAIATKYFPNAKQVADKYHIIAQSIDAVQDVRIKLRQEILTNQRKEEQEHTLKYQEYKKKSKENLDENLVKIVKKYSPKKLKNGETLAELLARSRYLLFKKPTKWNDYQKERSILLFEHFPVLKKSYDIVNQFRNWYEPLLIKDKIWNYLTAETALLNWIYTIENCGIDEILNLKNSIENNLQYILNYHFEYKTNAVAESINAKIKNAIQQNKGSRDLDFFHFRLNLIL